MNENIEEIIGRIGYYDGTFPKEELKILSAHREQATPFLLNALRNPDAVFDKIFEDENYFLPYYAPLMLAQFRETAAYPLVYELFSADAEIVDDAFGDFITEDLGRVLASVSGGDTSHINRLVEDENVYEFVRSAALDSWLCLHRANLKTREEVIAYFKTLFEKPCEEESSLRGSLAWHCLDLKAVELLPEIEKSYAENKIELMLMGDWNEFQKLMAEEKSGFLDGATEHYDLVDDMISDVETWHCFRDPADYLRENETPPLKPAPDLKLSESVFWESNMEGTFARETPKVGKNEPCPCGSGRKYKKCCMN